MTGIKFWESSSFPQLGVRLRDRGFHPRDRFLRDVHVSSFARLFAPQRARPRFSSVRAREPGLPQFFYGVVSLGQTVWGKENVVCARISEGGVRLSKHWNVLRAPPHPLFQCWSVDGGLDARSVSDEATPAR